MKPPVSIRWDSDHRAYALRVSIGPLNFNIQAPWPSPPIETKARLEPKSKRRKPKT